jgi:phosphatidylglycerophosphate synthase
VITEPDSRAATDALLMGLWQGRWRPSAWAWFLRRAVRRSVHQARCRPRALGEVTLLHIVFTVAGRRRHPVWTIVSWVLAATHLGMLEQRRSLGLADVITLTRANLPTLTTGWAAPVGALVSDLADGRLARGLGSTSPFGAAADSLADAAFWAWFALHHEPSRTVRAAALLAWVVPVITVTTASVGRGRMVDAPRPVLVRPAAATQAALAVRAVLRRTRRYRTGR